MEASVSPGQTNKIEKMVTVKVQPAKELAKRSQTLVYEVLGTTDTMYYLVTPGYNRGGWAVYVNITSGRIGTSELYRNSDFLDGKAGRLLPSGSIFDLKIEQ